MRFLHRPAASHVLHAVLTCLFAALASMARAGPVPPAPGNVAVINAPVTGDVAGKAAPVLRNMAVLEDPGGALTPEAVVATDPARFRSLPEAKFSAGYTRTVHWLRFTIDAPAGETWLLIDPPFLDDLRLYEPDTDHPSIYLEHVSGRLQPFSMRDVAYHSFVFKLSAAQAGSRTLFLRLQTRGSSIVLPRVVVPESHYTEMTLESGLLLGHLALLLAILLLNINDWYWLRDPIQPWFIGYVAALSMNFFGAEGFLQQYLTPDSPALPYYWCGASALGSAALGNAFYRRLFGVTRRQRVLYWLYEAAFWIPLLAIVPMLLGYYTELMPPVLNSVLLMTGIGLVLSWRLWRRRQAGGAFMFVANASSMLGIVVYALYLIGVLAGNQLVAHMLEIAVLGTVIALHLALGRRHQALRDERVVAQQRAARAEADAARERQMREQQGRFIDLVSHEYRTPLAVLQTNLDILSLSKDAGKRAGSIDRMGLALNRLRDILAGAQRQGDWGRHRQIADEPFDPAVLVREAFTEVRAAYPAATRRIVITSRARTALLARGDPALVTTVLRNLLENAVKYAPPDGIIDVMLAQEGSGAATITIGNDCRRVPELPAEALLQPYTRGANVDGQPGLGMGLYLSTKLAADMGAELTLDLQRPGRFEVTLALRGMDSERKL